MQIKFLNIFFGYKETMTTERTTAIGAYLMDRCGVAEKPEFVEVNKENLWDIVAKIENVLEKERKEGKCRTESRSQKSNGNGSHNHGTDGRKSGKNAGDGGTVNRKSGKKSERR